MKREEIKRLAVGVVLLMAVGLFCGCSADVSLGDFDSEEKLYGNLQGNILGGGNIIEYGDYILYVPISNLSESGETTCIYQIRKDSDSDSGFTMTNVFELPDDYPIYNPCLCIWDDDLYILQKSHSKISPTTPEDGVIRRISLDSGETEEIVSGKAIIQMQIRDGELYYLEARDNNQYANADVCLIRSNLDGSDSEELMLHKSLTAMGDFFFTETEEDPSEDSVIFLAPRNYITYAGDIVVTNLETGESGQITPDSWREEVTSYSLIDTIWPEEDKVYFTGVDTNHSADLDWPTGGDFVLSETEQTIEALPDDICPLSQCVLDNQLYTFTYRSSDASPRTPVISRTDLETMKTETYLTNPTLIQEVQSDGNFHACSLQATSQGVFLVVSPFSTHYNNANDVSGSSSLYYLSPSDLKIIHLTES